MAATTQLKPKEMIWQYPGREGEPFVLRSGTEEVGWIRFCEEPAASSAFINGQHWVFRYTVKLHPHVSVSKAESPQQVVAEFQPCWTGGGWVIFDSGARYRWRKAHLWGGGWCFTRMDQEAMVCLSQEAGPLIQGGKVSVCCGAPDQPETPVLLLLAWFLRIMDFEMLSEGLFRVG